MKYNRALPKNSTGYIVGNRTFATLRDAENYCNDNDFDVNEFIKIDLIESKEISKVNLTTCEVLLDTIQKQYDKMSTKVDLLAAKLQSLQNNEHSFMQSIDIELTKGYLMEANAERSGLNVAMSIIRCQQLESMTILRR